MGGASISLVKCICPCHADPSIKHVVACCNSEGWEIRRPYRGLLDGEEKGHPIDCTVCRKEVGKLFVPYTDPEDITWFEQPGYWSDTCACELGPTYPWQVPAFNRDSTKQAEDLCRALEATVGG